MLIVLPPSETKWNRSRGRPVDPATWSFRELTDTREKVATALREASAGATATELLRVTPGLLDEVARNLALDSAPATPAAQVYTGVLYDALDLASLDPAARRRAQRWVVTVSALYGAVRPGDRIAAYRLNPGGRLPGLPHLAQLWRPVLGPVLAAAAGPGAVVDARSSSYTGMWTPDGDLRDRWVHVRVPGASHWAKHTRGLVARHLLVEGVDARSPGAVAEVVGRGFQVRLHEPAGRARPWVLDVEPRT